VARLGFTTRASCLVAAGVTALLCGVLLGVVDLTRAGAVALALPVITATSVYRTRVRIAHRRSAEPVRASTGVPVTVHLEITNRSVLRTGALLLEDQLPAEVHGNARFVLPGMAARETRTVSYRMPELPRGRYRAGPLRIRLTDPFRLVDVVRSFTATTDFLVSPIVDPLPVVEPPRSLDVGENAGSHSIGARGADDASTREYRTGDDLRKIHWRSSARAGALMVRLEERPWQGRTTLLLDLRACAHQSDPVRDQRDARQVHSLEWAVSAAASIGSRLLGAGRDLELLDDQDGIGRFRPDNLNQLLDRLTVATPTAAADLGRVAGALHVAARESATIAVLGRLDPGSLRVLAATHRRSLGIPAFAILLDTTSWLDRTSDRTDGGSVSPPGPSPVDVTSGPARVLRDAGWRVVVVRRGDAIAAVWSQLVRDSQALPAGLR
jgi:uncharacterized protein (DUF58 family)